MSIGECYTKEPGKKEAWDAANSFDHSVSRLARECTYTEINALLEHN